jgi:hypothetical protein
MSETRIFKYPIPENGNVLMASGSQILSVQMQNNQLCIWAEVNQKNRPVKQKFIVVGTGFEVPGFASEGYYFLQTVQHGPYVWHVYMLDEGNMISLKK